MKRTSDNSRCSGYVSRCEFILVAAIVFFIPASELHAELAADFLAGSGFSSVGQLGTFVKFTALALAFFWAVWGIISEARAMSAGNGDSVSLGGAVIRGAFLPVIVGVLILLLT